MNATATSRGSHEAELDEHGLASVTLSVNWSDGRACHEDRLHVEKFSVWREADLLPPEIGTNIPGMRAGARAKTAFSSGEAVPPWDASRQLSTKPARFDRHHRHGLEVDPRLGRFYPQGFLHGTQGIFNEAAEPARITKLSAKHLVADLNHPLARFDLQVECRLDEVLSGYDRRGGRCTSPLDDLVQYPGLAAPLADGRDTDYGDNAGAMSRVDDRHDAAFYAKPRMVQHLDTQALKTVNGLYRRLIPAQSEVLDLMASFDSHLQAAPMSRLHVLGMNAKELASNRAANHRVVRDLNDSPDLPFASNSFDAILCAASIEYLTRPAEVLAEALRVLRPGGVVAITFSNRWFPTKAIRIWSDLHEFERVGMVTQWLEQVGFTNLHTLSSRGWPRPADDPHAGETLFSDPVYASWGLKAEV